MVPRKFYIFPSPVISEKQAGILLFIFQDHSVWGNQQFWEASFYQDVQREIKSLYQDRTQQISRTSVTSDTSIIKDPTLSPINPKDVRI